MSASKIKGSQTHVKDSHKDFVILLIGKTGHGKSSTGNTILGRTKFHVSDSGQPEANLISVGWTRRFDSVIKVVDGAGIHDARVSAIEDSFAECVDGFHALVLVLSYGVRFTKEEHNTIQAFKKIFGDNFIKDHGVLVFTRGDDFDLKFAGEKTFEEWCNEQTGGLREAINEFQGRFVLFGNTSRVEEKKKDDAVKALLDAVRKIPTRYTNAMFEKQSSQRDRLIVELGAPEYREEVLRKINLLMSSIATARNHKLKINERSEAVKMIKADATSLLEDIEKTDRGTAVFTDLKNLAQTILTDAETVQQELGDWSSYKSLNDLNEQLERERKKKLIQRIALGFATLGFSEVLRLLFQN